MRFVLSLLIAFALIIIITVGFGPAILSTEWGKSMLVKSVNHFTSQSLKVDVLHLSWRDGQQMAGVELLDQNGKVVFSCEELSTDATLLQLLARHEIGNMKAVSPKVTIEPQVSAKSPVAIKAGLIPSFTVRAYLPDQMNGDLTVEKGEVDFLSPGLDPIQLQNISMSLHIPKTGPLYIKANGQTVQTQVLGKFDLEGTLDDAIELNAHLVNFPTRSIDQTVALFQPNLRGVLTSAIGDALNVDLQAKSSAELLEVSLDANSPNFKAHVVTKSVNDTVMLQSPALVSFIANPEFAKKFGEVAILKPVALALKIDDFQLPLADRESFTIHGSLSVSDIQLPDTTIQPAVLSLATENAKEGTFTATIASPQLSVSAMRFQWKESLTLLNPVTFSGMATGSLSKLILPPKWQDLQVEAQIDWQGKVALSIDTLQSVNLDYTISQFPAPLPPLLSQPATVHVKLDPVTSFDAFKGTAAIDSLSIQDVALQNILAPFQVDRKNNTGSVQLSANVAEGTANVHLGYQDGAINASGACKQLPVHLFEILLKQNNLSAAIGTAIDLSFDVNGKKENIQASIQGSSDLLKLNLVAQQKGNTISLVKPGMISYTLTKEGYKALDQWLNTAPGPFELESDAALNLALTYLQLPSKTGPDGLPSVTFDPAAIQLQGDLNVDHLAFVEKSSGQVSSLNNVRLHLAQSTVNAPLSFHMHANVEPKGNLILSGAFDHATASTTLELNIDQFPASILDVAARSIGKANISLSTILGSTVNATAAAQIKNWSGPLKINVNAPNTRASLDGSLKDGILTLNDAIYAQITMTPDLSQMLLKNVNPLSISYIRAGHPLTLEIPASGFAVQLHPFSMSGVTIPNARIELGQIFCQNGGNLNTALGLLKLSQFSKDKEIKLWFAPIDLHISKGVIDCERTEILVADTYDICTWGEVDLVKNYVDMVLGLTASCLKQAFGIKELPSDYVLQIPMKGPTDNVKLDSGKATGKVTALLLWQQKSMAGEIVGGSAGALLGGILDKLGPLPDSDSKAPRAKHPFPWESSSVEQPKKKKRTSEAEHPEKKKHIKSDEKPWKQLLKILK